MVVDERYFDFMIDVAWKGYEGTQKSITELENKAYNMISLSGIFIAAIIALLVGVNNPSKSLYCFLIYEVIILISCVGVALGTIWFRKHELLSIYEFVDTLNFKDVNNEKNNFVMSLEKWQIEDIKKSKDKSFCLKVCMLLFLSALVSGVFFVLHFIFAK
jgi:hypothetical protein